MISLFMGKKKRDGVENSLFMGKKIILNMKDEIFIIVTSTGMCFTSKVITYDMLNELHDDINHIIRSSDLKEIQNDGETWKDLPKW